MDAIKTVIFIFLLGCLNPGNNKSIEKETGKLENNLVQEFYENGNIHKKYYVTDSIKNGLYCEYYNDGNIYLAGRYKKGLEYGVFHEYYKTGEIKTILQYAWRENESFVNNCISLRENGDTIYSESSFLKMNLKSDTINYGDTIEAKIDLCPYFTKSEYHGYFTLKRNMKHMYKIYSNKNSFSYKFMPKQLGHNSLVGKIEEVTKEYLKDSVDVKIRKYVFNRPYFVK